MSDPTPDLETLLTSRAGFLFFCNKGLFRPDQEETYTMYLSDPKLYRLLLRYLQRQAGSDQS